MKTKHLNRVEARAEEIVRTLKMYLPKREKYRAEIGILLRHVMEIYQFTHSKAKYRYGVEIELEFEQDVPVQRMAIVVRNLMREAFGDRSFSVQEDESLILGFELVTAPMTYNKLLNMAAVLEDIDVVALRDYNKTTAGLHITVDPFPSREKERIFFNYFNNETRLVDLQSIIGRLPNEYCQLRKLTNGLRPIKNHNYVVHLRENRACEVRIFASPHNFSQFKRCLTLVHRVNQMVRCGITDLNKLHKNVLAKMKI